jgi:hypothetical protein
VGVYIGFKGGVIQGKQEGDEVKLFGILMTLLSYV